jgi:indole-3-glycerol phosphate synthase
MTLPNASGSPAMTGPTVLRRILSETYEELQERKRSASLDALRARVERIQAEPSGGQPGPFHKALARPGIGVIAEFKRRSPSAGLLRETADVASIVSAYERGGASALSVLTEGPNFEGSLEDLRMARASCGLPILRKDFVIDPYQLYEARDAGADAVLLIVAALQESELASLYGLAGTLGLDVLVEVHDLEELACAVRIGACLIGVNNRDLRDFTVDVERTSRLLESIPAGTIVVSESGIAAPEQLHRLEGQGVSAVLVGETLMRAPDPQRALAALLEGSSSTRLVAGNRSSSNLL